jgi:hypothetical protein
VWQELHDAGTDAFIYSDDTHIGVPIIEEAIRAAVLEEREACMNFIGTTTRLTIENRRNFIADIVGAIRAGAHRKQEEGRGAP